MLSISNDSFGNDSSSNDSPTIGDRILEAAAYCVVAYGVDRVTLAEIARRARVSRPTVYRRWPDTRSILAALLTARITGALDEVGSREVGREALVVRIVAVALPLAMADARIPEGASKPVLLVSGDRDSYSPVAGLQALAKPAL